MPLARGLLAIVFAICLAAAAFAQDALRLAPREIRTGDAEMVIQRVEPDVAREEVVAAVSGLVESAPICMRWPGVWLDESRRRNIFIIRYDLMTRDWGAETTDVARARMQDFVDAGFLSARDRTDIGVGVVEYALTAEGASYMRGSPYTGEHPNFCAPSQRHLVEITAIEPSTTSCGSLRVTFTHEANEWPVWARTESLRERLRDIGRGPGSRAAGAVSLSRQWFSRQALPEGRTNGQLVSLCYDARRNRITGDDLQLGLP